MIKNNVSCIKFNTQKETQIWWMYILTWQLKQINIKNRSYYFYNDIINLDEFDGSKIKVDKKNLVTLLFIILAMNIRKKLQNVINKINSVNPLYLRITDMKGQFKKGKDDNVWYLIIFGDTDVSRIYANIWISIRARIIKMIKMIKIIWE